MISIFSCHFYHEHIKTFDMNIRQNKDVNFYKIEAQQMIQPDKRTVKYYNYLQFETMK